VLKISCMQNTVRALWYFDGEVPHRFLSPWFGSIKGNKREVYAASQSFANDCLYAVDEQYVVINPNWIGYLASNSGILKHFCYWNLSLYLQKHNPNVPDIPNKLVKLPKRNSLNKHRREFWDLVIDYNGPVNCIYTNRALNIDDYAVEHFIPYAFVSHDLIWNLIPADKSFNSSKSDKLPPLAGISRHILRCRCLRQRRYLNLRRAASKFLQDYLTIIPDLGYLNSMHADDLKELFKNNIQPLITIANNNGFEFM
jgi:5-methylcytosine-specific restriction endonuclease McrA